jgi:hypothetical protein
MFERGGFDMSEDIKPGDTVYIYRKIDCCGYRSSKTMIPFVAGAEASGFPVVCPCCGHVWNLSNAVVTPWGAYCEKYLLKKIPPLNELEDQTEERKVEV